MPEADGASWLSLRLAFALGGGTFLGFLAAVGFAFDGDDLGVMNETVDHGDGAAGVGKHFRPFREAFVGREQCALLLVAAVDQLEQQIGMTIGIGEVADLVDDQQAGAA